MNRVCALLLCLALQENPPEKTVGYGNVLVRVPEGWRFEYKEEGLFLRPGDLKQTEALVVIFSLGRKAEGTLADGFEKMWKQTAGKRAILNRAPEREFKTGGGVDGLLSVGLIDLGDNDRLIATVAAFKPGDRIEGAVAMTAQQAVFERYSEAVRGMFRGARFRNVELPVAYTLLLTSKPGEPPAFRCQFEDGSLMTTLPPEGMEGFDLAEARTRFEKSWGTHVLKDGKRVFRIGDREELLDPRFVEIPAATGLRLEGRYVVVGRENDPEPPGILFKADGTYVDRGGLKERDSGTYSIARNSLTLMSVDARPRMVSFVPIGKEAPTHLLIGGTWLKRQ